MDYTNNPHTGFDIAERFRRDGKPAVLRRAWFSNLSEAETYMRATHEGTLKDRRIIDCASGAIVAWRGIIGQVDPIGARGPGENAISLADWLDFRDTAVRA